MFQNVSKKMPSTSRPRVAGSSSGIGRIPANTPMSERQQMALLMQMTSASNQAGLLILYYCLFANIHTNTQQIDGHFFFFFLNIDFGLKIDAAQGNSGHGPARSRDRNERGETQMHVAAIKGDQEGIKKLLEQGMSPNVPDFAGITHIDNIIHFGNFARNT